MNLAEEYRASATSILRAAGFSRAWVLNSEDPFEIGFLVPRTEGDVRSITESASTQQIVESLMAAIPHSKVAVGAYRDGLDIERLY